jgi:cell division septum initiation protein DivIVA
MAEQIEKLRQTVKELEEELAGVESFNDETRQMLQEAVAEIQTVLTNEGESAPESVIERLRAAEQEFQASHPTLSGIVARMIDALGQLGI